jgi:4'-phosphopantetheinyl transferase EntD
MIEAVLPSCAAWSELFDDPSGVRLYAEEEASLGKAVHSRRQEFSTGRMCARAALATIGVASVPIPRGERGAPRWPPGIVGSITHCVGYRAATVARTTEIVALGIDAEPDLPLERGVLSLVAQPDEAGWIEELTCLRPRGPSWDRLLFSAKEAVFKAWFPLTGQWLGFEDAEVKIDPLLETFIVRLRVPGPEVDGQELTTFHGRWLAHADILVAATAVPVRQSRTGRHDAPDVGGPLDGGRLRPVETVDCLTLGPVGSRTFEVGMVTIDSERLSRTSCDLVAVRRERRDRRSPQELPTTG